MSDPRPFLAWEFTDSSPSPPVAPQATPHHGDEQAAWVESLRPVWARRFSMKTKRPSLEQIIRKLREVEGMLSARCAAVSRRRAAAPAWTSCPLRRTNSGRCRSAPAVGLASWLPPLQRRQHQWMPSTCRGSATKAPSRRVRRRFHALGALLLGLIDHADASAAYLAQNLVLPDPRRRPWRRSSGRAPAGRSSAVSCGTAR